MQELKHKRLKARIRAEKEKIVQDTKVALTPVTQPKKQATGDFWHRLRVCESGNNYGNKNNPTYRGAYQFSFPTWQAVGGVGDPADAPPDEQDMRAKMLSERANPFTQWPVCWSRSL